MKYLKKFESYSKSYWVFEPVDGYSAATSRFPTDKYSKDEAIAYFSSEKDINKFKPVYLEEEETKSTITFKEERSDNDFIQWLRDEKGFDGDEYSVKDEYSSTELDYLYNEFTGY